MSALKSFLDVKRRELRFVLSMFLYFFLVITVFWILKPIKKTLLVNFYPYDASDNPTGRAFDLFGSLMGGAKAELIAKVANMVVAVVATIAFTMAARRLRRHQLTVLFGVFSIAMLAMYFLALGGGGALTVWSFYLFGDLFNTLMVATFFAFLNDSVSPDDAKRLYGPIVLGGVAGGAFGSLFVAANWTSIAPSTWLLIAIGLTVVLMGAAIVAGRWVLANPPREVTAVAAKEKDKEVAPKGSAALEGAKLVFRSRYLLSVVAIVGIYEIVSTMLDFQFTSTVTNYLTGDAIGQQFSTTYAITNTFALLVQLFATSFVMKRLGVRIALLVMPIAILGASAGFLALPILWVGCSLNTVDNGLNYSINQSSRETLYTVTSRDEKYAAKAFIDMFVQRFAKAIAVFVTLAITAVFTDFAGVRWLSIFVLALGAVWLLAASYAGKRFKALADEQDAPATDAAA